MGEIERHLYLIGEHKASDQTASAYSWGDCWWAHEVNGRVQLTLFGITPEEAARFISEMRKGQGE